MSIVVNGKTELCDTSKDIMSRKNVNNISGILLLILMACNYNNLSIRRPKNRNRKCIYACFRERYNFSDRIWLSLF